MLESKRLNMWTVDTLRKNKRNPYENKLLNLLVVTRGYKVDIMHPFKVSKIALSKKGIKTLRFYHHKWLALSNSS